MGQNSVEKPGTFDLLVLATGQRMEGHVLNEFFSFHTAYGEVKLPARWIAEIEPPSSEHGLQTVLTVNSNRLTGFLEDSIVRIEQSAGAKEVRRERVERITFAQPASTNAVSSPGQWILLRNGDRLSGEVATDPLHFIETGTNALLSSREYLTVAFGSNSSAKATVQLRSGQVRRGIPTMEEVEFRMVLGPAVLLPVSLISEIGPTPEGSQGERAGDGSTAEAHARESLLASVTNRDGWVWIAPGQFVMGSPTEEPGRDPDEGPQTRVVLTQGFWMSKYEVTQAQFQSVMGNNPSNATGDPRRPVERVTWFEAVDFCKKLTELVEGSGGLPKGYAYRLPTESEWEYACRAGTVTRFSFGEDKNATQLGDYAWFTRNSDSTPHPVGSRRPNPWGLYDMHGNVWEWCLDRWEDALPGGTVTNVVMAATGTLRVARGGSWLYEPKACRSANRDDYSPWDRCSDIGFRVLLAPMP